MKDRQSHRIIALIVLAMFLAACGTTPSETSSTGDGGITGHAIAGPVCPVVTDPPDPGCAPRPVVGAHVAAQDQTGRVIETTTDASGAFTLELPPGTYVVQARPVEGLMGSPSAATVEVSAGAMTAIDLVYDTGIR